MLRKKDNVSMDEFLKFGFKYGARDKFLYKTKTKGIESSIYIDLTPCHNNNNELKVESLSIAIPEKITDKLYDLINSKLVEKV